MQAPHINVSKSKEKVAFYEVNFDTIDVQRNVFLLQYCMDSSGDGHNVVMLY